MPWTVTTGAELFNGPMEITGDLSRHRGRCRSTFQPGQYEERAALLLSNGAVYTSWTSHCDIAPYSGWIIAYNQRPWRRRRVLNIGAQQRRGAGDLDGRWWPGGRQRR